MSCAWAVWSSDAIVVYRQSNGRVVHERISPGTPPGLRYFIRLYRRAATLVLRSGDETATRIYSAGVGDPFAPLAEWPAQLASLPVYRVTPLRDGTFAGLPDDRSTVHLWRPGEPVAARALPRGFHARAIDQDEEGRIVVAGSVPTERLRSTARRHAFAVSADRGLSWKVDEKAHGRLTTAWLSILSGAELEYSSVACAGRDLVLAAEMGDIGEESTLLYVRDSRGRWTSDVMRDDLFRAAVSLGHDGIEIFSHRAKAIAVGAGRNRRRLDLEPWIRKGLAEAEVAVPADARYEVLAADSAGGRPAILASIQAPCKQGLARYGDALCTIADGAARVIHFQPELEPEVVTFSLL